MSVTRLIAAVVGLVLAQSVMTTSIIGQTPQPSQFNYATYFVRGVGNIDCGEMTNDLRTDRSRWSNLYSYYSTGFLTGTNFFTTIVKQGNPRVGENTSPEAVMAAMEQYCGQHPLEKMGAALESVYLQLAAR